MSFPESERPIPRPTPVRPRVYHSVISDVVVETPDTVTLELFTGHEPLEYKAGQFINIDPHQFEAIAGFGAYLQHVKGRKEPARSYSMCSAPHESRLRITVKQEPYVAGVTAYPPLLTPFLVRAAVKGTPVQFTGFSGPYVLPDDIESRTDHLVHIVAGSGSVPNFAILKDALHRRLKLRHTFLYSNKTWADICFRQELETLERRYPQQLKVVHTLTREKETTVFGEKVRPGRLNPELLEELIPDRPTSLVYACGPAITSWERRKALETREPATPRFMETVISYLHELGIEDKRIKRETYG